MEEEDNYAVVSGDVENIIIKLEPNEDFLGDEDTLEFGGTNLEFADEIKGSDSVFSREFSSNETHLSSFEQNESNIVQTPFFLENYFSDNENVNSREPIDMKYLTCEECKIVFTNERLLQEHLATHIDIHRMGCNVCDKDLNTAEKFQLHVMAITRQSIYHCDLCKKSCAGVVRSKDQARPLGKTYACHDCEVQAMQKPYQPKAIFQFRSLKNSNFKMEFNLNSSKFNLDSGFHKCNYCDAFFAQPCTLSRHVRERHNHEKNKDNNPQKNLKPSMNTEATSHQFKCTICELGFSGEFMLAKHLREDHKHGDDKTSNVQQKVEIKALSPSKIEFKCKECNISYPENLNLIKHSREKHKKDHEHCDDKTSNVQQEVKTKAFSPSKIEFKCNEFNISCPEKLNLIKQSREKHKKVEKFICKSCLKEFTSQRKDDKKHKKICRKCEMAPLNKVNGRRRRSKRIRIRNS